MRHLVMQYFDIPVGGEWRYPSSGTVKIHTKLKNGNSVSSKGASLHPSDNEMVILVRQPKKAK